jgi:hypothetical protein
MPGTHLVLGDLGGGKTLYSSLIGLKDMEDTNILQVACNYPLVHPEKGPARQLKKEHISNGLAICDSTLIIDEAYEWWRVENFGDVTSKEQRFFRTARQLNNDVYLIYQNLESVPPWLWRICKDFIKCKCWKLPPHFPGPLSNRVLAIKVYHWKTHDAATKGFIKKCSFTETFINWPGSKRFKRVFDAYDTTWYRTKLEMAAASADEAFEPVELDRWSDDIVKEIRKEP